MDKSLFLKWLLIFLLFLSCGFDIYSTISDMNFLVLESNFLFNFVGSIWIIILFKILFCLGLSLTLFFSDFVAKENIAKFFYIHMIILFICLQFFAGYNNLVSKENATVYLNNKLNESYEKPSEIPEEIIEKHIALSAKDESKFYILFMIQVFYLPFLLGLISFWLWENIFFKPSQENKIIEEDWKKLFGDK